MTAETKVFIMICRTVSVHSCFINPSVLASVQWTVLEFFPSCRPRCI